MTIGVQAANTEVARAAVDIERHHNPVPGLEALHRRTKLEHYTNELMAECHADSRVGHHAVIQMQIRPTDCRQPDLDNCVVGVLQRRNIFFLDADLVRSAVNHCPHSASWHSESPCRRFGVPSEAMLTHRAANLSASVTKYSQPAHSKPIRIEPVN